MRCDEVRHRLLAATAGLDPAASAHLLGCPACFAAVESADPVVTAFRAARPEPQPVPAHLAGRIVAAWSAGHAAPARPWTGLVAMTALLAVLAAAVAALVRMSAPAPVAAGGLALGRFLAPVAGLGATVQAQLTERPLLLVLLAAVGLAAAFVGTRLDLRLAATAEGTAA